MSGFGFPEYGRLRKVLMHAPGNELDLISPARYHRFLFEDAIDPKQFRIQHESLVSLLRSEGVEVFLLTDLLRQNAALLKSIEQDPNTVYTRDAVTVTRNGFIAMRMRSPVRQHEPRIIEAAMHQLNIREFMKTKKPATMEGGDLIFLDEETLFMGVGNRTGWNGFQQLKRAGKQSGLLTLIAVQLPPWVIHLDGTMMILDRDLALIHPRSLRKGAIAFEEGKPRKHVVVREFLKNQGMRLIEITDYERQRRALNVVTLRPRRIVCYAGNSRVRGELVKEGVDVIEVEGSELIRGAGGPRCLTAPIARD